jgi:hypothetical protein
MAKKEKQVPLTPEEIAGWTTTQHCRRAFANAEYWQQRVEKIQKLENPSANQLAMLPWLQQHGAIWLAVAEKLGELNERERQQRADEYEKSLTST